MCVFVRNFLFQRASGTRPPVRNCGWVEAADWTGYLHGFRNVGVLTLRHLGDRPGATRLVWTAGGGTGAIVVLGFRASDMTRSKGDMNARSGREGRRDGGRESVCFSRSEGRCFLFSFFFCFLSCGRLFLRSSTLVCVFRFPLPIIFVKSLVLCTRTGCSDIAAVFFFVFCVF